MLKRLILVSSLMFIAALSFKVSDVKADTVTATYFTPTLQVMYGVDQAQLIVNNNARALKLLKANKASQAEIIRAQALLNDSQSLLNTLNALVARDAALISVAPAGKVNPPTFAVNSLSAQGAWHEYSYKAAALAAGVYPILPTTKPSSKATVYGPFCMY